MSQRAYYDPGRILKDLITCDIIYVSKHLGAEMDKQCKTCAKFKPEEEFISMNGKPTTCCRLCLDNALKYASRWRTKNPEKAREVQAAAKRKRKYGISREVYNQMVERQKGGCACCGNTTNGKSLAVDHNHNTGAIRGLLCHQCNTAMGLLNDNPKRLQACIDYLLSSAS